MSDAIKALVKAQMEMGAVVKNAANPHLKKKYADLGAVMDACFDALHKNGFAVMQPGGADEYGPYVETVFAHESGETFRSRCYLVIGKQDMQGVGSAWTYARRYGLLGMAGLAPEDDDGEGTKRRQQAAPQPQQDKPAPRNPKEVAESLIGVVAKATTEEELNKALGGAKFDAAWQWLAEEHENESHRVREAVDAARQRVSEPTAAEYLGTG